MRTYSDVAAKAETVVKQNYTRSVYAASISRQSAFMSLLKLENTLRLLKTRHGMQAEGRNQAGSGGTLEEGTHSREDCENDETDCTDTASNGKQVAEDALRNYIEDVIRKFRDMKLDVDDMERNVAVLDHFGIVNDAVSLASSDVYTFYVRKDQERMKRKEVENMVRSSMPFDR